MLKIYVPHSSSFDFKNELYLPIRKSALNKLYNFYLPQENGREKITKDLIRSFDLILAEVSYLSTGQGIELGWVSMMNVPIICIYNESKKYSPALYYITNQFVSYKDKDDMIVKIKKTLEFLQNSRNFIK
ncbi:MAG: hypothetical protein Fur009_5320 [Candidatus Microgenomates bacterium]